MSRDQLQALLDQLKDDEELQQELKSAADLDAAVAIAQAAGFEITKEDWLTHKRLIGPHWLWEWSWV